MSIFNRNLQSNLYNEFIDDLEEIVSFYYDYVTVTNDEILGYKNRNKRIIFSLVNGNEVRNKVKVANILIGSRTVKLDVKVKLLDLDDSEKSKSIIIKNMIELPIVTKDGLFIGGERKTFTNVVDPAKGWQYEEKKIKKEEKERFSSEEFAGNNINKNILFRPERGSSIICTTDSTGQFTKYVFKNLRNSKKILVGDLVKAFTGLDWTTIRNEIGEDSTNLEMIMPSRDTMISKYGNEIVDKSILECRQEALNFFLPYEVSEGTDIEDAFKNLVLENKFYKLSEASMRRVNRFFSFENRCRGLILAKSILVSGNIIKKGTQLTPEILEEIDESNTEELVVEKNEDIFVVKKLKMGRQLDGNHLINALNVLNCELNNRGLVKNIDEIENKISSNCYTFMKDYVLNSVLAAAETIQKQDSLKLVGGSGNQSRDTTRIYYDFVTDIKSRGAVANLASITLRNSVSATAQHFKVTSSVKEPTIEQREVRDTTIGYICSQGSPESEKTGITQNLSAMTFSNKYGELCNIYAKIKDGVPTGDIDELTSYEAQKYYIIDELPKNGETIVKAWRYGNLAPVNIKDVNYVRYTPVEVSSRWATIGPFFSSNKSRRTQMSSNHSEQAIPIMGALPHIVSSGMSSTFDEFCIRCNEIIEIICLMNNKKLTEEYLASGIELISINRNADKMSLEFKSNHEDLPITFNKCVDYLTTVNQMVWSIEINEDIRQDHKWYNDEIVLKPMDISTVNKNINPVSSLDFGLLDKEFMKKNILEKDAAIGRPVLVSVGSFRTICFEDGMGFREGFIRENHTSNVFTHKEELELTDNKAMTVVLKKFSDNPAIESTGLPRLNNYYNQGETLVEYEVQRREYVKGKGMLLKPASKHTIKVKTGYSGYVQSIERVQKGDKVVLVIILGGVHISEVGDKFTGHHGNKGTICRIVPDEEMPCLKDGTPVDVCINTLGLPSRMILGPIKEILCSKLCENEYDIVVCPPYAKEDNKRILEKAMLKESKFGNVTLYKPQTLTAYPNKVNVGYMYLMKLDHSVGKKINAISEPNSINSKTGQPSKSAHGSGGQSISELTKDCILANNCIKSLDFMFAGGSDDLSVASGINEDLVSKGTTDIFGNNNTYKIQHSYFRILGFDVRGNNKEGVQFGLLTNNRTKEICRRIYNLDMSENALLYELPEYNIKGNRKSTDAYVGVNCENIAWVNPAIFNRHLCKLIPIYNQKGDFQFLSAEVIKKVIDGKLYLTLWDDYGEGYERIALMSEDKAKLRKEDDNGLDCMTGGIALLYAFSKITKDGCIGFMRDIESALEEKRDKRGLATKDIELLDKITSTISSYNNLPEFSELITNTLLLTPLAFRMKTEALNITDPINILYKDVLSAIKKINSNIDLYNEPQLAYLCTDRVKREYNRFYNIYFEMCTSSSIKRYKDKPSIKSPLNLIKDKDIGASRGYLLSKKLKWSMRSVIVGVYDIPMYEIQLPKQMAYTTYCKQIEGWLQRDEILKKYFEDLPSSDIQDVISDFKYGRIDKVALRFKVTWLEAKSIYDNVYVLVDKKLQDEVVAIIREPSSQRQNIGAYIPRLTENKAMGINYLICPFYNADFDGDQMEAIAAINEEQKDEMRAKMFPDKLMDDDQNGKSLVGIKQDLVLGLYGATSAKTTKSKVKEYDSVEVLQEDLNYGILACGDLVRFKGYYEYNFRQKEIKLPVDITGTAARVLIHMRMKYGYGVKVLIRNAKRFIEDYKENKYPLGCFVELNYSKSDGTDEVISGPVDKVYKEISEMFKEGLAENNKKVSRKKDETVVTFDCVWDKKTPSKYNDLFNNEDSVIRMKVLDNLKDIAIDMLELYNTSFSIEDFDCLINRPNELREVSEESELYKFMNKIGALGKNFRQVEKDRPKVGLVNFMDLIGALNNPIGALKMKQDQYVKRCLNKLKSEMSNSNNIYRIFKSGSKGDFNNCINSCITGGFVKNLKDEYISVPIESSLFDGLSPTEIFRSGYEVRNTQLSTTGKTKEGGELGRLYGLAMSSCYISEDNCGAKPKKHKIYYKIATTEEEARVFSLLLDKNISVEDEAFALVGGEKLTSSKIEYLISKNIRKIKLDTGLEVSIKYTVDDLTYLQYVGRMGYRLDDVNKGNPKEVVLTKKDINGYIDAGCEEIYVRLTWDCKSTKGVCRHCYGDYNIEIGTNVGIRSAQSIAKTLLQLALDKKNAVTETQNTSAIVSRIKGILELRNKLKSSMNAIYANYKQKIDIISIDGTKCVVNANNEKNGYIVNASRVLVSDGMFVEKGTKLIDGSECYGYISKLFDIDTLRLITFLDYWNIYNSNGIDLLPIHFELLVRAQTNSVEIESAPKGSGLVLGSVHSASKIREMIEQGVDIKAKPRMSGFTQLCIQDSPLKAVCSRDPMKMLSLAVKDNMIDSCDEPYSKLAGGFSLHLNSMKSLEVSTVDKNMHQRASNISTVIKEVLKQTEVKNEEDNIGLNLDLDFEEITNPIFTEQEGNINIDDDKEENYTNLFD